MRGSALSAGAALMGCYLKLYMYYLMLIKVITKDVIIAISIKCIRELHLRGTLRHTPTHTVSVNGRPTTYR